MSATTTPTAAPTTSVEDAMAEGLKDVKSTSRKLNPAKPKTEPVKLTAAQLAWLAKNARPAVAPCLCGCGATTKGRFAPGHDAKLHSALKNTPGTKAAAVKAAFGW